MSKRESYTGKLEPLLASPAELEDFLLRHSALPGRRANLELAAALADRLEGRAPERSLRGALWRWASLGEEDAPTNSRLEYLPFCATQALGACYLDADSQQRRQILEHLRSAARDRRWRMREATCFGFQRIGSRDPVGLRSLFEEWLPRANRVDLRAMLVTLADPPLLEEPGAVGFALELADHGIRAVAEPLDLADGNEEEVRVLKKCLGFTPSVFAAADPERGFELLSRWAADESLEVRKLVAANLRKARLAKRFPEQVQEVGELLAAGG